jgi:hypothetical protein
MPSLPQRKTHYDKFFLLVIVVTAFLFRLCGVEQFRMVLSALAGIVSVMALYVLVKRMFGSWSIAAMASFMMATSAWHTLLSRSGTYAMFGETLLLLAFAELWRSMATASKWHYSIAALLAGASIYYYPGNWIGFIVAGTTLATYWFATNKHLTRGDEHGKSAIGSGIALFTVVGGVMLIPWYLGFLYTKIPVIPGGVFLMLWPIGMLACIGFLRIVVKLIRHHKHGHFSTLNVFLLTWLITGLAVSDFIVLPVAYILAAEALWWFCDFIHKWYNTHDQHVTLIHGSVITESALVAAVTSIIFLGSVALVEYCRIFYR